MRHDAIQKYSNYFIRLKRGNVSGMGRAPHKPILLLAVLDLIRNRTIRSNKIFITPELVLSFKSKWMRFVTTPHNANFSLPFFHLKGEPFWHLQFNPEFGMAASHFKSIGNFSTLQSCVLYAEIDQVLFDLLSDEVTTIVLERILIETYFSSDPHKIVENVGVDLRQEIESEILNDPPELYRARMETLTTILPENQIEEERFIRNGIFKREVPKIYGYRCCISEMQITTGFNIQMIDACHIVPFSISKDDTLSNGISLCPNLHRAYDRGLITITENFVVRVSPLIAETVSAYMLKPFDGKRISLPFEPRHYPSSDNLAWHRKERFLM